MNLYEQWLKAKADEKTATDYRRQIEDELIQGLDESLIAHEGSTTFNQDGFKVKLTVRYNRKINSDTLQEVAAENGLTEHLSELFRWKPEINKKAWDAADFGITTPLLEAITTTPGRPSFQIEPLED